MGIVGWFKDVFGKEEEIQEAMRLCDKCGIEYPEALMINSGSFVLCSECNVKRKKEISDMDMKRKQALATQKIKFYCYQCKFHFARKKDFGIKLCPNCGSSNFVEEDRLV